MIGGFIVYDLTHIVKIEEESFSVSVSWLKYKKSYLYKEVSSVQISESSQSFATVTVVLNDGNKVKVFFADEADKIKTIIEDKKFVTPVIKMAA